MKRTNAEGEGQPKRDSESKETKRGDRPSSAAGGPQPSCLDIARRAGFIGVYKDAPADLSTNVEHMEGFGRD